MRLRMAKSYVFGKMLPKKWPLVVFKVFKFSLLTETQPFRGKGEKFLSSSQLLLENAHKGCWTATGQC